MALGEALGPTLGAVLGPTLGVALGGALGPTVGDAIGSALGEVLGDVLGTALGDALGPTLGAALGRTLGTALGDAFEQGSVSELPQPHRPTAILLGSLGHSSLQSKVPSPSVSMSRPSTKAKGNDAHPHSDVLASVERHALFVCLDN
jgi:hypothetical protein